MKLLSYNIERNKNCKTKWITWKSMHPLYVELRNPNGWAGESLLRTLPVFGGSSVVTPHILIDDLLRTYGSEND